MWLGSESPAPCPGFPRRVTGLTSQSSLLASYLGGCPRGEQKSSSREREVRGDGWREGRGLADKERSLPVDEEEVRHEAQHRRDGGGNGQVALEVVLQAQK